MSRTDAHAPYWVKLSRVWEDDPYNMEVVHTCHRRGVVCDFDEKNVVYRWQAGFYKHCYVEFTYYMMNAAKVYSRGGNGPGRRLQNRLDRGRTNAKLRKAVRTPVEDLDDFFVYDRYPDSAWWW